MLTCQKRIPANAAALVMALDADAAMAAAASAVIAEAVAEAAVEVSVVIVVREVHLVATGARDQEEIVVTVPDHVVMIEAVAVASVVIVVAVVVVETSVGVMIATVAHDLSLHQQWQVSRRLSSLRRNRQKLSRRRFAQRARRSVSSMPHDSCCRVEIATT